MSDNPWLVKLHIICKPTCLNVVMNICMQASWQFLLKLHAMFILVYSNIIMCTGMSDVINLIDNLRSLHFQSHLHNCTSLNQYFLIVRLQVNRHLIYTYLSKLILSVSIYVVAMGVVSLWETIAGWGRIVAKACSVVRVRIFSI